MKPLRVERVPDEPAGAGDEATAQPDWRADEAGVVPMVAPGDDIGVTRRLLRPETIVSFLFSFAILVFFLTRLDIDLGAVAARLAGANPWLFGLGFAAYYLSFPVRAARWRRLLGNAGLRRETNGRMPGLPGLTEMIFLSWFANCIVPAKLGDAYRSYQLKRAARVSFSTTIGTILVERIADVLVLFGLMAAAGLIAFHGHLPGELLTLLLFGGGLAAIVVVGLIGLRGVRPLVERLLPERLRALYLKFEKGILQSVRPGSLPALLGLTGLVWLLEGLRLYLVAAALGLTLPLSVTLFIALASSLLTTIPFTPAGLGVVESAMVTVLLWFQVDAPTALSVSFLDRLISYWSIILIGFVVYLLRQGSGVRGRGSGAGGPGTRR